MRKIAFFAALLIGLSAPAAAQPTEKELVFDAVKLVSAAISEGDDITAFTVVPELDEATVAQVRELKGCRGSAMQESTLELVKLFYRCGRPQMSRSGSVSIPPASRVDLSFEAGTMTGLTVTEIHAVPVKQ